MDQPNPNDDDPGWPPVWTALSFMVPGLMRRRMRRPGIDALTTLRQVFLSFTTALVSFGIVLAFIPEPSSHVLLWPVLLAVAAVGTTVIERSAERPLDCSSATALAGTYRTRFFLRIAFAESVALLGFVLAFIGGTRWIYYAGAAFTLVRLWTQAAPTRSALERDQAELNARGCGLSLIAALRGGDTPTGR